MGEARWQYRVDRIGITKSHLIGWSTRCRFPQKVENRQLSGGHLETPEQGEEAAKAEQLSRKPTSRWRTTSRTGDPGSSSSHSTCSSHVGAGVHWQLGKRIQEKHSLSCWFVWNNNEQRRSNELQGVVQARVNLTAQTFNSARLGSTLRSEVESTNLKG